MVHRREINGEELVLGNQGALFLNALTWWDHDTGSVWSQPTGEAILGPRVGDRLDLLPSTLTEWASWRRVHRGTLALDADAGLGGFSLDGMVIVVELAGEAVGYPIRDLRKTGVVNDEVGGAPIAVVLDPEDEQSWAVFSRQLSNRVVDLTLENGTLAERGGTGRWDPARGLVAQDPADPEILALLPGFTSFPGQFLDHFPHGEIRELP